MQLILIFNVTVLASDSCRVSRESTSPRISRYERFSCSELGYKITASGARYEVSVALQHLQVAFSSNLSRWPRTRYLELSDSRAGQQWCLSQRSALGLSLWYFLWTLIARSCVILH